MKRFVSLRCARLLVALLAFGQGLMAATPQRLAAGLLIVGANESAVAAANLLPLADLWRADADSIFLRPNKAVTAEEWRAVIERAPAATQPKRRTQNPATRAAAVRGLADTVDFTPLPLTRK